MLRGSLGCWRRGRPPRNSGSTAKSPKNGPPAPGYGVLLQIASAERRRRPCPGELRSDAEDREDELALRYRIALGDPADLTFADCVHRLVALDRSARTLRRPESEARRNPLLDKPMVLLNGLITNDKFCLTR